MARPTYRDESRTDICRAAVNDSKDDQRAAMQVGSLQRIADALEKMAASYTDLEVNRDWWRERAVERNERANRLERRLSATRGVVTKLKRQIAAMRARAVTP